MTIMRSWSKALADRLAEAFAELLHQRVREQWGYGQNEPLSHEDLIAERYRGIRPAPGYPVSTRSHRERDALPAARCRESIGVSMTENCAMLPAASVCGLYFAHPQARYFAIGRLARDQIEHTPVGKVLRRRKPKMAAALFGVLKPVN